ncbi:MAG: hypothetical protein AAGC91_03190, partial [Pseudomonadota bacterium]
MPTEVLSRFLPVVWLLAGALLYWSCGYTEMMGSDLWWHIAGGREVIQTSTVWLRDTWSFTEAGSRWHNHEWLADLVFYDWVQAFGLYTLVYWKWAVVIATFLILQRVLFRTHGNHAAAFLSTALAALIASPFIDIRPHLYTLLGVSVLLLMAYRRTPKLWQLLLLFLVWVNLHGGFIFGLMLLGILLMPDCDVWPASRALVREQSDEAEKSRSPDHLPWHGSRPGFRTAAIMLSAVLLICLANPSGIQVFMLPLTYALDGDSPYRGLGEWITPFKAGGIVSPMYPYTLVIAASLALAWVLPFVRRRIPVHPEALAFTMLTAAMSMTSRRFIVLWAFGFALLVAPYLAYLLRQTFVQKLAPAAAVAAVLWGAIRLSPYPVRPDVAFHFLIAEYAFPHAIADYIEKNHLSGKVFAYYNWGGFLHWRTDGAMQVYIDGRANTLFDDETYLTYLQVLRGRGRWLQKLEATGVDYVIWPRSRGGRKRIRALRGSGRWIRLYRDSRGELLVRKGVELPPTMRIPSGTVAAALARTYSYSQDGDMESTLLSATRAHDLRPWDK